MSGLVIPSSGTVFPYTNATPTFSDNFNTGSLNASMWSINNFNTPGVGAFVNTGVTLTGNTLNLVTTNGGGSLANGGQISSVGNAYFHGTYQWTLKAAADANGVAHSGCVTSPFLYLANSVNGGSGQGAEIDIVEIQGQYPSGVSSGAWSNNTYATETLTLMVPLHKAFHTYTMMFNNSGIYWFFDGLLYQYQTTFLPTLPMTILVCLYPTNSGDFGGLTSQVVQQAVVTNFSYWALP